MNSELAKDITATTVAFGITAAVSTFITSTTASQAVKTPTKIAVIAAAFLVGVVLVDASKVGVESQIDGAIRLFKKFKKD